MGFLNRFFGSRGPVTHPPASEVEKKAIMLLGMSGDFDGLAKRLRSKNPHVRTFTVDAVLFASQVRPAGGGQMHFSATAQVDTRAVRLLIPLLDDQDGQVRLAAEKALASLEDRSRSSGGGAGAEAARALAAHRNARGAGGEAP